MNKKIVVIGGGAAGMMAALSAAEQGAQVTLLEPNERLGKKLNITGKGRCNVTNNTDIEGLLANIPCNGKFLYSAFNRFNSEMDLSQTYALLDDYFKEMLEMCKWGRFDVLGHLTYPLRYIQGDCGIQIDLSTYKDIIREIFCTLIQKGKGIEINVSG